MFAASAENPSVKDFDGPLGAPFWRALPKPPLGGWENRMLARVLADMDRFVPMQHVHRVTCPTLFVAARNDDMVPLEYVQQAVTQAASDRKELAIFPCGHFDLYLGPHHAENARRQAEFLAEVLGGPVPG